MRPPVVRLLRVIPRAELPPSLIRLADAQAGVLARRQILQAGVSASVAARWTRKWSRLGRGTFFVSPAGIATQTPWAARLWAGILMGQGNLRDPDGPPLAEPVIGGLAAAVVHGLADRIDAPTAQNREARFSFGTEHDIDVHVDVRCRFKADGYRFVRSPRLRPFEGGDAPCTSIVDTVLDLCDLGSHTDAVAWIDRACQRRVTTPQQLIAALRERKRVKHRATVKAILEGHLDGLASELERTYYTNVERAHGLPRAVRQWRAGSYLLDNRYEKYNVIVELDGRMGHAGEGRFRDRRRDNVHTLGDQRSLRYGWEDCFFEPCEVAAEVARLLRMLGWTGLPLMCPRCPPDIFIQAVSYLG